MCKQFLGLHSPIFIFKNQVQKMVPGIVGLYFHLQPPTGYPLIDSDFASPLIQSAQKVWQS